MSLLNWLKGIIQKKVKSKTPAIDLFDKWAHLGKDKGMELGHSLSGNRIIEIISKILNPSEDPLSILEIGCGNGWLLRKALQSFNSSIGLGIDGSKKMILNAHSFSDTGNYECSDISKWRSKDRYDIIMSMEVLYYLMDPLDTIKRYCRTNLNDNGIFIMGIDHYKENHSSLSWPTDLNVFMNTLSINDWINILKLTGLRNISYEQFSPREDWGGTLIIYGIK